MNLKQLITRAFLIALVVITTYMSIGYFTHNKVVPKYGDRELREYALSKGLKSSPKSFDELGGYVKLNDVNRDVIALGEELFFDKNLSLHKETSCSTCHSFDRDHKNSGALAKFIAGDRQINDCKACHLRDQSGVDRFTFSVGDANTTHPNLLNTQSIFNSGFYKYYTWSGEVYSLRDEISKSFELKYKMGIPKDELMQRVSTNEKYGELFERASLDIKYENLLFAMQSYIQTLVTYGAYDRFLDGDDNAISPQAKRGLANFIHLGCKGCHSGVALGATSIQKFPLRDFANVYDIKLNENILTQLHELESRFPFDINSDYMGKKGSYLFRVPSLRNVAKTSPYFHNGGVAKLREAVNVMARYQLGRHLKQEQIDELVAFLQTLDGDIINYQRDVK